MSKTMKFFWEGFSNVSQDHLWKPSIRHRRCPPRLVLCGGCVTSGGVTEGGGRMDLEQGFAGGQAGTSIVKLLW